MSRYYAKGSQAAKNIIGDTKDHFGIEYQNAQPESQALAFIGSVLFSDERLFGGYGTFVQRNIREKGKVLTLEDREYTKKKFKKGELHYKETPLGGCMGHVCDKRAMRSVVGCIDCKNAVIKLSRVKTVIKAYETVTAQMKPGSIEHKMEIADLEALRTLEAKLEPKNTRGVTNGGRA